MSIRGDMQDAARKATARLGPDAAARIAGFLRGAASSDGGFVDRAGRSDLYYTAFAVDALLALGAGPDWEALVSYLGRFGGGEELDLVHLASLVRAWSAFPPGRLDSGTRLGLLRRLETFRAADGGYAAASGAALGDVYGAFVALGCCQDLGATLRDRDRLLRALPGLAAADGGFGNEPGMKEGITPVTAAAAVILRELGAPVTPSLGAWLLARHVSGGGFVATPSVPVPDLLSAATALFALVRLGISLDPIRNTCRGWLDTLWDPRGAFRGGPGDAALDCEHTYYGLLAHGLLGA
jgi:hypothetical protein